MTPATLRRRRALMRATLWVERLAPALAPACALLAAAAIAVLLGAADALPFWPHIAALALLVAATAALLVRALSSLAAPTPWEVDRRLEAGGNVAHQPLLTLSDTPASPAAAGAWQAHLERQRRAAAAVRPTWPRPVLALADPRAIRAALALGLLACAVAAGPDAPGRLARALVPQRPPAIPAPLPLVEAWITPPAYTGQPPSLLGPGGTPIATLSGTTLVATVTNAPGAAPTLRTPSGDTAATALNETSWQARATLTQSGPIAALRDGTPLAAWPVTVTEPTAPTVLWPEPPGPAADDLADATPPTRLPWEVRDTYGVTALRAELRLRDRPDLPPLLLPLTLPGVSPRAAHGVAQPDLSAHPFAGLPVTARLVAENGVPLSARSDDAGFSLPARPFRNPVARALIAARRMLTLRPEDRRGPAEEVWALGQGDDHPRDTAALLELGAIPSLLMNQHAPGAITEAQSRLWALALKLEDATQATAAALEAARQAAQDALKQAEQNKTPETKDALDKRLSELRAALDDHLGALAERDASQGQPPDPRERDIGRQAQQDADAAREEARRDHLPKTGDKLADLDRDLQRLKREQAGKDPEAAQAARDKAGRQRGQQQLNVVQDMVQRETKMVDQADRRARGPARTGPEANTPMPDRLSRDTTERQADGRTQTALRRALGELLQQSGDLTGAVPKGLTDADQAMRDAADAMGRSADAAARADGERAVASLQQGSRELADALRQKFGKGKHGQRSREQSSQTDPGQDGAPGEDADNQGDGQGDDDMALEGDAQQGDGQDGQDGQSSGGQSGKGGKGDRRDPFGRALTEGGRGLDDGDTVRVPTEMERQRARDLRGELRGRAADQTRPQPERSYIERLLQGTE